MKWYDILSLASSILLLLTSITSLIITKLAVKKIDTDKPFNATLWSKVLLAMIIVALLLFVFGNVFEIVTIMEN